MLEILKTMNINNRKDGRKAEASSVKTVIEDMLKSYHIKDKFDANKLIANWEEIMGTAIARRTDKVYVKNKVLYAQINSPALRNELNIAKKKVMDLLREHVDEETVKDVKFV